MMRVRPLKLATMASLTTLSLMLAACGGGGGDVNSTPAPTPAPTPTTANEDLVAPLVSESFTNNAATGTGSYPLNGDAAKVTAAKASLAFGYDAKTGAYMVSTAGRSQTFANADIASQNADQVTYARKKGDTEDSLLLTKAGTSGALNYQYVGSGFWQRTRQGSSKVDGTIDAFTYGVETPDANVPRSGAGTYDVVLLGSGGLTSYAGAGNLSVDFGSGQMLVDVGVSESWSDGTSWFFPSAFRGSGAMASGNAFSGKFSLATTTGFNGTFDGRFYGPASEEVGAAFYGDGTFGNGGIVGTLMGRKGTTGVNTTLVNLNVSQDFVLYASQMGVHESTADGTLMGYSWPARDGADLRYEADGRSWSYSDSYDRTVRFLASQAAASADGRFTTYDNGAGASLNLYRVGSANPEIKLTYASFGYYQQANPNGAVDGWGTYREYFHFGVPTVSFPSSGTATYTAKLIGIGANTTDGFDLSGTAHMSVNFGNAASLAGTLDISGANRANGGIVDFGRFGFSASQTGARFTGNIDFDRFRGSAWLDGSFYGPNAAEMAAMFGGVQGVDPNHPLDPVYMVGAFGGKRD